MSLYRKHRPQNFADIIGQEAVVKVLKAQVKEGKLGHAYLFAGSRGTGKTSIARIFARAIGTKDNDLYEIDAASNRGIDEVRELREGVQTLPFESKYKVYIIDEVHMLTTPAFNALLKTLEEPPPHVIFILATTESHKLPSTIISRCQVFTFKKPSEEEIIENLSTVAKVEGLKIEKGALGLIALLAEGSFRDSLTILEKVLTVSSSKAITEREVEEVSGAPRSELVEEFIGALLVSNKAVALEQISKAVKGNVDMKVFTKLVLRTLRGAMLLALSPAAGESIKAESNPDEISFLAKIGKGESAKKIPNLLRIFLSAYNDIGFSYIPSLPLELAIMNLND